MVSLFSLFLVGGGLVVLQAAVVAKFMDGYRKMLESGKNDELEFLGRDVVTFCLGALYKASGAFGGYWTDTAMHIAGAETVKKIKEMNLDSRDGDRPLVMFVGSSTFTYWLHLEEDIALENAQVVNAAFGGSLTKHQLKFVQDLVIKAKPEVVVWFCGTNDLATGIAKPKEIVDNFKVFRERVLEANPETRFVYLSLTPTPFHAGLGPRRLSLISKTNALAHDFAEQTDGNVIFCDAASKSWVTKKEHFLLDNHHFTPEAHKKLGELLRSAILQQIER